MKYILLLLILISGCGNDVSRFQDVTFYDISGDYVKTPDDIIVYLNGNNVDLTLIDQKVNELEQCLDRKIKRDSFKVYIPDDWYISPCSGEQLIPSLVDPQLCENKGLEMLEDCRWKMFPTAECPCPCSVRATIQNDNVVITTPNLKLFKMPLTRMVIYPEYLMDKELYRDCAWN